MSTARAGAWSALAAYGLWGFLPVYWKALDTVSAPQILAHRIVWSFAFLVVLIVLRRETASLLSALVQRRTVLIYAAAAVLLAINWFTYIWAVNAGRIVETSLGYYINPLMSVALGVAVLRENLRRTQWIAVGGAAAGVCCLTWQHGNVPWIALVLAVSFGLYGLFKKTAPLPALPGLAIETAVLLGPAVAYLAVVEREGSGAFGHAGAGTNSLLAFTGVVTALPLLLFASAARKVELSTLGLLQYVSPTCGLFLGVWVYHEPFGRSRWLGFGLIWISLALYWAEGAWRARRQRRRNL